MTANLDDDEYVATLLKQDAKQATKKYELVGIDAFNPRRMKSGAPKPNTNFLRHIIRQTDSHNAALLAKEAEDSNARLKSMNREWQREKRREEDRKQKKADGRLTPELSDKDAHPRHSKRHRDDSDTEAEHDRRRCRRDRESGAEVRSRRHKERSRDADRRKRRHEESDGDRPSRKSRKSRSHHDSEQRRRHSSEEDDRRHSRKSDRKHHRRKSYSRSASRSRSRSPRPGKSTGRLRRRDRSRSPNPAPGAPKSTKVNPNSQTSKRRSRSPTSDSDPLEAIVGPLPPPPQPTVRSRGRGANKANSMGIESHFSSTYDPSIDVHAPSDAEDDWGDAVEAFRDRQKWKQQGADRLKAAGFSTDQIAKWEKGDEPNEEDVVWTRKGQAREWDRGKVVDSEGDVELKADFGRLK